MSNAVWNRAGGSLASSRAVRSSGAASPPGICNSRVWRARRGGPFFFAFIEGKPKGPSVSEAGRGSKQVLLRVSAVVLVTVLSRDCDHDLVAAGRNWS